MDKFNLKEYLKNNRLLKEEMEVDRFDYDDPNSPLAQLNDDDNAVNMLNDLISKYGKDVVQYWVTSGEYYDEDYLQENNPLLNEDLFGTYWPEWAEGEVEVGNSDVIDAGGVDAEEGNIPDETMSVFKDYVKAVKALNADSKSLRNDIATAVSAILYDIEYDGDLTQDQLDKIKDII